MPVSSNQSVRNEFRSGPAELTIYVGSTDSKPVGLTFDCGGYNKCHWLTQAQWEHIKAVVQAATDEGL